MSDTYSCEKSVWRHPSLVHPFHGSYDASIQKDIPDCFRNSCLGSTHLPGPRVFKPIVLYKECLHNNTLVDNAKENGFTSNTHSVGHNLSSTVTQGSVAFPENPENISAHGEIIDKIIRSNLHARTITSSSTECVHGKSPCNLRYLESEVRNAETNSVDKDVVSLKDDVTSWESITTSCVDNGKCLRQDTITDIPNTKPNVQITDFTNRYNTISCFQQHAGTTAVTDSVGASFIGNTSSYHGEFQFNIQSTLLHRGSFHYTNHWPVLNFPPKINGDYPFSYSPTSNHLWNVNHEHNLKPEVLNPQSSAISESCLPDNLFLNGHKSAFNAVHSTTFARGSNNTFHTKPVPSVRELNIAFHKDATSRRAEINPSLQPGGRNIRISSDRPFKCECGRSFARNEELTRHRRIHSGYKPHRCHVCSKRFGRKDHLSKHLKTHLRTSEKKTHVCLVVPGCRQSYTRSDALTRHQWTAHGIPSKTSKWRPAGSLARHASKLIV